MASLCLCVFFGLFVAGFEARATTEGVAGQHSGFLGNNSCEDVRQRFVEKNIGSLADTRDMVHEDETPLCSASWNASCCTPTMERRFSDAAKKEFQRMLQSSNSFLHSVLAASAAKFRESFLEMVHASHNNTLVLFSEVYKKMDGVAREPVSRLYADLADHISSADHTTDHLADRVRDFFNSLFPLVYHHSINPKLKDFSEDYKECLRATQQEIRPFGDIAERVSHQIQRSFSVARAVLDSLGVGVEVIEQTATMHFRSACNEGLMSLVHCSQCSGYTVTRSCSGYCLNVVRGCLAHVAELDQPWSDFVSGLERVSSGLVGSYNIEEVLGVLDTKISEAIMYAMENGPELSKKVKVACGHPRRATRDLSDPIEVPSGSFPGRIIPVRSPEDSVYGRLQQVVQQLAETKGHYANLADSVCSDETWAVRKEGQCWNGHTLGQYTHTIAGVGVAAQKYNPEMKAPEADDLVVMALDEKLQKMSRKLRSVVSPDADELPQADSSYPEGGSGSGGVWPRNQVGDDEDYDRGSGSGDWGGTKPSDFNFDQGDTRDVNIKVKDNNGAAAGATTATLTLLFLTTISIQLVYRYNRL